jgi:hypothetical protein
MLELPVQQYDGRRAFISGNASYSLTGGEARPFEDSLPVCVCYQQPVLGFQPQGSLSHAFLVWGVCRRYVTLHQQER